MSYNHTIRPEAINILGSPSPQGTHTSTYTSSTQKEPTRKHSLWDRVKQAVSFIKEEIVPIVIAAAGLLNAYCNIRRCTGYARDNKCYA